MPSRRQLSLRVSIGRQGTAKQCRERRKLHGDLIERAETRCPTRIARMARLAGIRAQIGYKRKPDSYGGRPSVVVDNTLDRQFDVTAPDTAWVSDITYIKTYEGFLYLAVVIDLYSRRVIGWANLPRTCALSRLIYLWCSCLVTPTRRRSTEMGFALMTSC